jgi:hypothetical protein
MYIYPHHTCAGEVAAWSRRFVPHCLFGRTLHEFGAHGLKMEALCFSETLVPTNQTIGHYNPQGHNANVHSRKHIRLYIVDYVRTCREIEKFVREVLLLSDCSLNWNVSKNVSKSSSSSSSSCMALQPISGLGLLFMRFRNLTLIDNR